jgi:lipoprotein-releasing system ATP-binding protein
VAKKTSLTPQSSSRRRPGSTENGPQITPVLQLENITRSYTEGATTVPVLHGVNLALAAGQSVAIVGPSGSGKSTLLHVAGLLDTPTSGTVKVRGQIIAGLKDDALSALRNSTMGFVYQFHHLLREFTALENVLIPYRIAPWGPLEEAETRAYHLLEKVGLGHRLTHSPSQLSGGEQQRVAIARALMNKPALLLADEPTGNLDPHTAEEVTNMLFGLIQTEGLAMLVVTHNTALAARCSQILTMHDGVLGQK